MTIEEFIVARLAEEERLAIAASPGPWHPSVEHEEVVAVDDIEVCTGFALSGNQLRVTVEHIVRHDPTRTLRQCRFAREALDAYRTAVEAQRTRHLHAENAWTAGSDASAVMWLDWVVRGVAAIWCDHPDYNEGWEP